MKTLRHSDRQGGTPDSAATQGKKPAPAALLERFRPRFKREGTFGHWQCYLSGLLADLKRKSIEPPAREITAGSSSTCCIRITITDNVGWLDVSPPSGTSSGEADPIQIIYDTADLEIGTYPATITVTSPEATNSPESLEVTVQIEPVGPDFDADGDVDQEDFGHLQACLSGPGEPQNGSDCQDARLDIDEDVDQDDFDIFENCMSGANVPPPPGCDE